VGEVIANQAAVSAFGIAVALAALYLALRVVETALKALWWGVALAAGYSVAAPWLDWPGLADVIHAVAGFEFADQLQQWLSLLRDVSGD